MNDGERYRKGVEILRRVGGPNFDAPLKALADVAPDLVRFAVEFGYGDIMSRPGLDLRTRQLVTVALLTALGRQAELCSHVGAALDAARRVPKSWKQSSRWRSMRASLPR